MHVLANVIVMVQPGRHGAVRVRERKVRSSDGTGMGNLRQAVGIFWHFVAQKSCFEKTDRITFLLLGEIVDEILYD
jgi:hypothetical protein